MFNDNLDFVHTTNVLANSGGRALGAIITKFKFLKNMGYETYTSLFEKCVSPIIQYCSNIWGFKSFAKLNEPMRPSKLNMKKKNHEL